MKYYYRIEAEYCVVYLDIPDIGSKKVAKFKCLYDARDFVDLKNGGGL